VLKQRRLIIDVGTNSVLALLADIDGGDLVVILDQKKTTRLGEGLISSGKLSFPAMKRTAEVVAGFVREGDQDLSLIVGTEALRIASNTDTFADMLDVACGQKLNVISGLKEAELTYLGSLYNLKLTSPNIFQIDVGGGSTELTLARNREIVNSISIPTGALKLYEKSRNGSLVDYMETCHEICKKETDGLNVASSDTIVASGGTITSAAAIDAQIKRFDFKTVHGRNLTVKSMKGIADNFEKTSAAARSRLIPFDPQRADLILPGLGIFLTILGIINRDTLVVSAGGLRFGVALYPDKL
jgi:exopolyphosphatase / guanosine-5'-triphosphate,3'-diphosphate pyrophosphatase